MMKAAKEKPVTDKLANDNAKPATGAYNKAAAPGEKQPAPSKPAPPRLVLRRNPAP